MAFSPGTPFANHLGMKKYLNPGVMLLIFISSLASAADKPVTEKTFYAEPHAGMQGPILDGLSPESAQFARTDAVNYAKQFGADRVRIDLAEKTYFCLAGLCTIVTGVHVGHGSYPSWTPIDPPEVLLVTKRSDGTYKAKKVPRPLKEKVQSAGSDLYVITDSWAPVVTSKELSIRSAEVVVTNTTRARTETKVASHPVGRNARGTVRSAN